jgi:hypothetical protein
MISLSLVIWILGEIRGKFALMMERGHELCNIFILLLKISILKISAFFHPCVGVYVHYFNVTFISSI